jgi:hypothetical protein
MLFLLECWCIIRKEPHVWGRLNSMPRLLTYMDALLYTYCCYLSPIRLCACACMCMSAITIITCCEDAQCFDCTCIQSFACLQLWYTWLQVGGCGRPHARLCPSTAAYWPRVLYEV